MKSKLLLVVCILVMIGLVFIQSYLIKNTYDLEKKEFFAELKAGYDPLIDSRPIQVLQDSLGEELKRILIKRGFKQLSEIEFESLFKRKVDSIKTLGDMYIKEEQSTLYQGDLRFRFNKIVFKFNGVLDSIITSTDSPVMFMGEDFNDFNAFVLRDHSIYTQTDTDNYNYEFWREYVVDINVYDKESIIIKRMSSILVLGIVLILLVIILFYTVFNALIKQKKLADIKTDFANNITHELQTPITTLGLAIKNLKMTDDGKGVKGSLELLDIFNRQVIRMKNVVDQVMEASLTSRTEDTSFEMRSLLDGFVKDFVGSSHRLKYDVRFLECQVKGDRFSIERILQNLLDNAVKYSPVGSEIIIRSYIKRSWLYVEVEDHGVGIEEKYLKLIFTKFYRVTQGDLHNTKGLGLGLFLCKQLIEAQGGYIDVKSRVGQGTVFFVKISVK